MQTPTTDIDELLFRLLNNETFGDPQPDGPANGQTDSKDQ